MRYLLPFAAFLAAGTSIWPDLRPVPAGSKLCQTGLCRFDQLFSRIDAEGVNLGNVGRLLEQDPMNPLVWCVYADLLAAAGKTGAAAETFDYAISLGPGMSPVLMRAANFDFAYGQTAHGMRMAREILLQTDAFDQILFADLMHSGAPISQLLGTTIPGTPRVARAWLEWVRGHGSTQELAATWAWIQQNRLADRKSAVDVTRALWERKALRTAQKIWAAWLGSERNYLNPQRLANTRFENEPSGSPFDWKLDAPESVQLLRQDGLEIRFSGTENVHFSHVSQFATVDAGRYRLSVEVRANGLTTDERPFFRVFDSVNPVRLDVATAPLPEKIPRSWLTLDFAVPRGTEAVQIQIERRPSHHFDNKISGTLHVYQVSLTPASTDPGSVPQ